MGVSSSGALDFPRKPARQSGSEAATAAAPRAAVTGGSLRADDDCCDAKMVAPGEIPWDQLAFLSSHAAIKDWLRLKG